MKYKGPIERGSDWDHQEFIEVHFESHEEFVRHFQRNVSGGKIVVRTSPKANLGDRKTLVLLLPNRETIRSTGTIERIRDQVNKPYSLSLFRLHDFDPAQRSALRRAVYNLPPEQKRAADIDPFEIGLSKTTNPPKVATSDWVPSAPSSSPPRREEDDASAGEIPVSAGEFFTELIAFFTENDSENHHPEHIFRLFQTILDPDAELGLLLQTTGKEPEFLIFGVTSPPRPLSEFSAIAGKRRPTALFNAFQHAGLAGVSLPRCVGSIEFETFLETLLRFGSETSKKTFPSEDFPGLRFVTDDSFTLKLDAIPFPVELILSRFLKDFRTLSTLPELRREDREQAAHQLAHQATESLQTEEYLASALLALSQISSERIPYSPDADPDPGEMLIALAKGECLAEATRILMHRWKRLSSTSESLDPQEKATMKRLLDTSIRRLRLINDPNTVETLRELYENELLEYEKLPAAAQERVTAVRLADLFIRNSGVILAGFEGTRSLKEFQEFTSRFLKAIPPLLEQAQYRIVVDILESVARFSRDRDPEKQKTVKKMFVALRRTNFLQSLLPGLRSSDARLRNRVAAAFAAMGSPAVPFVVEGLRDETNKYARKALVRTLVKNGSTALPALLRELDPPDSPWYFVRNILNVLAEMGNPEHIPRIEPFLSHDHPGVRKEALETLFVLKDPNLEEHLFEALNDPDGEVRELAVSFLGDLKSQDERAIGHYIQVLDQPESEHEEHFIAVCRAIGALDNLPASRRTQLEFLLARNLLPAVGVRKLLGRLANLKAAPSQAMILAVCNALGKIGHDRQSLKALSRLTQDPNPTLSLSAGNAAREIRKRL